MTDFEKISVAVAQSTFVVFLVADIIAFVALVAAIFGGWFAYRNIKVLIWNSLLSFEQDMAARRIKFHEIMAKLREKGADEWLQLEYNEAKESYFNSLDRLASSILISHFPDKEMRRDYQEVLIEVVRAFPADFNAGTRYRKVLALYSRWQDR